MTVAPEWTGTDARHEFLERVYARRRLRALWRTRWRPRDLVAFHTREKLQLLAHSVEAYRALGRLVARAGTLCPAEVVGTYSRAYLRALGGTATRGRHVVALQHAAGHLRGHVEDSLRQHLDRLILDYHRGRRAYREPFEALRKALRDAGLSAICQQSYLQPYPEELMLEAAEHADRL